MKKVILGQKIMDVIDEQEYNRRSKLPEPLFEDTCVEMNGMIYPVQKRYDGSPGVFDAGPFLKYTKPVINQAHYESSNIIDYGSAKSFEEIMKTQDEFRRGEEALLTTKDNITIPIIKETNTPELVISKQMVIEKEIDLDTYLKARVGADANNVGRPIKDKNNDNISFGRFKTLCKACDVEATLILEDKPGAINPMGKRLEITLTSGSEEAESE